MIMVGKVIVSIIWAFWIMSMSTVEGAPEVNQEDYESLHAEVIELRKIKEIHQQQHLMGEKNYQMKEEYFLLMVLLLKE